LVKTKGENDPMITLYGMGSPNVVKVYIALEELGLPYTVEPVDVFSGKQFDAAFLKLNPNAKVPVIVDSDGPGGKQYSSPARSCCTWRRRPASCCRPKPGRNMTPSSG
jgi:hypothetical protein